MTARKSSRLTIFDKNIFRSSGTVRVPPKKSPKMTKCTEKSTCYIFSKRPVLSCVVWSWRTTLPNFVFQSSKIKGQTKVREDISSGRRWSQLVPGRWLDQEDLSEVRKLSDSDDAKKNSRDPFQNRCIKTRPTAMKKKRNHQSSARTEKKEMLPTIHERTQSWRKWPTYI